MTPVKDAQIKAVRKELDAAQDKIHALENEVEALKTKCSVMEQEIVLLKSDEYTNSLAHKVAAILTPAVDKFYREKHESIMTHVDERMLPLQNQVKEFNCDLKIEVAGVLKKASVTDSNVSEMQKNFAKLSEEVKQLVKLSEEVKQLQGPGTTPHKDATMKTASATANQCVYEPLKGSSMAGPPVLELRFSTRKLWQSSSF